MAKYFWRNYICDQCGHSWTRLSEPKDPLDECPNDECRTPQETAEEEYPEVFSVGGGTVNSARSRAVEYTGRMLQEQYGIEGHRINDNQREGDIAVKGDGAPQAGYLKQQQMNVQDFLAAGRAAGGIGENNVTGLDIIESAKNAGTMDPRVNMTKLSTAKTEYTK